MLLALVKSVSGFNRLSMTQLDSAHAVGPLESVLLVVVIQFVTNHLCFALLPAQKSESANGNGTDSNPFR